MTKVMQHCATVAKGRADHELTTHQFLDALLLPDVDASKVALPDCQALRPAQPKNVHRMREEKAAPKDKTPRLDADTLPLVDKAGRRSEPYVHLDCFVGLLCASCLFVFILFFCIFFWLCSSSFLLFLYACLLFCFFSLCIFYTVRSSV
jgi:hypothetical protein